MKKIALLLALTSLLSLSAAQAGILFGEPPGGWIYTYTGDGASGAPRRQNQPALDGTWRHDNGSDEWNGDARGPGVDVVGGVEANSGVLTIEDASNSGSGNNNNRKLYFTHSLTQEGIGATDVLNTGVTLSFRARLTPPDGKEEISLPNGYGIFSNGKGNFGVRQSNPSAIVSFSLTQAANEDASDTPAYSVGQAGLVMNRLNGDATGADVDINEGGTLNLLPLDPTVWHEFWITIQANDATAGNGTHTVSIYVDGSPTPTTFSVTAGTGSDTDTTITPNWTDYITLGCGNSPTRGAFDIDFFSYKPGVYAAAPSSPPEIPTGIVVVNQDGAVALSWARAGGASSYNVKRADTSGGPYIIIASPTATNYVDTAVVNGGTYYYVISAVNTVGESGNSVEVVGKPNNAVTGVTAVGGTNQVVVSWNGLPTALSYLVQRSSVSGGPYTTVASDIATTSYTDTSVASGSTYYYVVFAQLPGGVQSGMSDQASATTVPSAPSLSATLWAATVINLKWTSPDPVVSQFVIEQATDGVFFTPLATVPGTQKSYTDSGLTGDVTYYYRIQAQNAGGSSEYSSVVSLKTPIYGWNVNFANAINGTPANNPAPTPIGYLQDIGNVFGDRGNGYLYGWDRDITTDGRWRQSTLSPDLRYDTFNHLQKALPSAIWEIEIPNGFYEVHVAAGESDNYNSVYQFDIEGVVTPAVAGTSDNRWAEFTVTAVVNDSRLTVTSGPDIAADTDNNNKICFIDIYPAIPVPAEIGTQPQAATVLENRSVTLSVVVTNGSTPLFYQWYQDSVAVEGATNAILTFAFAQMTNAGAYTVAVSNFAGTVTSDPAVLTVEKDSVPAKVLSAGSLDGTTVGIIFDEVLDPGVALDPNLYLVYPEDGSGPILPADLPILRPDGRSLSFPLALPIQGGFYVDVLATVDLAQNASDGSQYVTNRVLGYTPQDLGAVTVGGSYFVGGPAIELTASGADIWSTADQGYMALRPVTGDFDARVRVIGLTQADDITKAGLMARESTNDNSLTVHVLAEPLGGRNETQMGIRYATGTNTVGVSNKVPSNIPDAWVRLVREGDAFSSYSSSNGVDWLLIGTTNHMFPTTLLVGLAVSAHTAADGPTTTATFTDLQLKPVILDAKFDGTEFKVSFATVAGLSYVLEYKDTLADAQWQALPAVVGDGNVMTISDPAPASLTRFYRVRVQ